MIYKVKIMPPAQRQLEKYIAYTKNTLKSPDAAKSIAADARKTKQKLSEVAGSLKLCEDERLARHGYRIIHFEHHKFYMIYRINDDTVSVDFMLHELQDIDNIIV